MKSENISVGWSHCDFTPDRPVYLLGQFYSRLSTHVRDPLTATACAIEGDGGEVIIVSCDLGLVTNDLMRDVRKAALKKDPLIDTDRIIMSAIHTHTAPDYHPPVSDNDENKGTGSTLTVTEKPLVSGIHMTEEEVYTILTDKLSSVIVEAHANKKPAGLASQLEYCSIGFNRIMLYKDKSARMYGNVETADFLNVLGASDPGVEMVFVFTEQGSLEGMIIEVACPSQVVEHQSFISADYWGETRKLLRERFGDIEILPLCGSAGDQSPRDLVRMKRESSMQSGESPLNSHMPEADISRPGWEMYDERGLTIIAERIFDAVTDGYEKAKINVCRNTTLLHICKKITLPILRVSYEEYVDASRHCKDILLRNGLDPDIEWYSEKIPPLIKEEIYVPYGIMKRYEVQQRTDVHPVEIHAFRIGNTAFYSTPFELFLEYALRIRARAKYDHLVSIQLACGHDGYLPVRQAVSGKSYSAIAASSIIGPEGGDLLSTTIADILNSFL